MYSKRQNNILLEVGVKAFIYQGGKYLFLRRAFPYPDEIVRKWDIPGGRIMAGEPIPSALKREIKEETGLRMTKIIRILSVQDILRVPNKHTVRITYLVECNKGTVIVNKDEHSDFHWMDIKEIKKVAHDLYLNPIIKLLSHP